MAFVKIPAGEFKMGSEKGDANEKPVHMVRISQGFEMGQYPVTQSQWEAVMGSNPSEFKGPDRPVNRVSWEDVQEFIGRLNEREEEVTYRLPTEAEWEYACRAGSATEYFFGDDAGQLGDYAWYGDNAEGETHPVGQKKPNVWGQYDMHGNVWEWCQDWFGGYSKEPLTNPTGPASGSGRVIRGGGWIGAAANCRSSCRIGGDPGARIDILGFRLLRTGS